MFEIIDAEWIKQWKLNYCIKVGLNNKVLKPLNYTYTCGREYMSGNDAPG